MSLKPASISSITAASRTDGSNNTQVSLFYTYRTGDRTDIAMSGLKCTKGAASCSEVTSSLITKGSAEKVHSQSAIAAVWLEDMKSLRVYYQSETGSIMELGGDGSAESTWTTRDMGGRAVDGSGLAVSVAPGPILNVFYASYPNGLPAVSMFTGDWLARMSSPNFW